MSLDFDEALGFGFDKSFLTRAAVTEPVLDIDVLFSFSLGMVKVTDQEV